MDAQYDAAFLFEHLPFGVCLYDAHTHYLLTANSCFFTLLIPYLAPEWQQENLFTHPFTTYFTGKWLLSFTQAFAYVVRTGVAFEFQEYPSLLSSKASGGIPVYWNCSLEPVCDEQDVVIQVLITINDVSDLVERQRKLEQEQAMISQVYQHVEHDVKQLEIVETVSHYVHSTLSVEHIGESIVEAIHTSFSPLASYIYRALPEQRMLDLLYARSPDGDKVYTELAKIPYDSAYYQSVAYKTRDAIVIEDIQEEAHVGKIKKSLPIAFGGRGYVCIPLWFNDQFEGTLTVVLPYVVEHYALEVLTLLNCGVHIAAALAYARLHATVESEQQRLRAILDQLPEGILLMEMDGRVSYVNAAAGHTSHLQTAEEVGVMAQQHPYAAFVTRLDGQPIDPNDFPAVRALRGEVVYDDEGIIQRSDGSTYILSSSAVPLRDENGLITGAVSVFRDITEQKCIERQRDEFLSIASHELRTPITAIQGFAELLHMRMMRGDQLDTPRSARALTGIIEYSQHLTRLIEDMLDLSRIESDQLFVHYAPCDLLCLVQQVVETQLVTTHHHIHLQLEGLQSSDTLIVSLDNDRIVQVVNNLVNNAMKYSPVQSVIEVGLSYQAGEACLLWVKDRGIGVAVHELAHIFTRFHRADNFDRSISGLGIGLHLVRELVQRHQGQIWVESCIGEGSTFYVQLPLSEKKAS